MVFVLLLLLLSAVYLIVVLLIAVGLYKDPVLWRFERYATNDDSFFLLPLLLSGIGLLALFAGALFSEVAPQYPALLIGILFLTAAYATYLYRNALQKYPQVFLAFPRWYAELRERTTREERRRIAYMWLCLPRRMRLHLSGSDYHFLVWADQVILATVMQTVEDQEAKAEGTTYLPDLHGRYG